MGDARPLAGRIAWVTGSTRGIGWAVAFLASAAAAGITGAIVPVDAGFLCR